MRNQDPTRWWGRHGLAAGEARRWRIGGLELFAFARAGGWLIQHAHRPVSPEEQPPLVVAEPIDWEPEHTAAEVVHYHVGPDAGSLELRPALADLAVASAPRAPFVIAPGGEATLYVSTPLWVALHESRRDRALTTLPTVPLGKTWFGPSTRDGEVCYAAATRCLTEVESVAARPWRAVTPLTLRNRGRDGWRLERVALPVPLLPLFRAHDRRLWTAGLAVTRDEDGSVGALKVASEPPREAGRVDRLAQPRRNDRSSLLGRFYGNLF